MYERILITLDASPTDRAILDHVKPLARLMRSRVVLLHVATGWAARWYGADAVSPEVDQDRAYLAGLQAEFAAEGIPTEATLAFGEPAKEIVRWVREQGCDLVAMSSHGHRFLADVVFGAVASRVQHELAVPVLLLRARQD
jgi:nucleotide-binding universal stress UspA family protein